MPLSVQALAPQPRRPAAAFVEDPAGAVAKPAGLVRQAEPVSRGIVKALEETLRAVALGFGFQGAHYVHLGHMVRLPSGRGAGPVRFLATSISDRRLYLEEGALAWDPPLARLADAHRPFVWSAAADPSAVDGRLRLASRLKGRGVFGGVAAPVQDYAAGPAYISFYSAFHGEAEAVIARRGPELAYAAADFHEQAKAKVWTAIDGHNLTPREIDCLRLAALGHTATETAEALQVTPRTVEFHLRNATDKFGAPNKIRAVALAVSLGLITP